MANEAEGLEDEFGLLDLAEFRGGDFGTVGNPRGEAGVGGFVPVGEAEFLRVGADGGFVDFGFLQGGADAVFAGGAEAGAVVTEVVGIGAVENPAIAFGAGVGDEGVVDVGFAEVATIGVVDLVARVLGLGGGKLDELAADFVGDLAGVGEVVLGKGRRDGDGGGGVVAEVVVGELENKGGVNTARVGDEDSVEPLDDGLELGALFGCRHEGR